MRLATAYLGLVPADLDPALPPDTAWHPVGAAAGRVRSRRNRRGRPRDFAPSSPTRTSRSWRRTVFTLSELRALYVAALGRDVSATNLSVLLRREVLERTGAKREPRRAGGRPAELFRFCAGAGDGPVRGPQTAALSEPEDQERDHGEDRNHNGDQHTHAAEDERRRALLSPRRLADLRLERRVVRDLAPSRRRC